MPTKVLLDTMIVGYYLGRNPRFLPVIDDLFDSLSKKSPEFYVSTITIQETNYWARLRPEENRIELLEKFLDGVVTPLPFDSFCAKKAAEFEFEKGRPQREAQEKIRKRNGQPPPDQTWNAIMDRWDHDCAIMGTAAEYKIDLVITAEKGWRAYQKHFTRLGGGEIRIIEQIPVPITAETAEPRSEEAADKDAAKKDTATLDLFAQAPPAREKQPSSATAPAGDGATTAVVDKQEEPPTTTEHEYGRHENADGLRRVDLSSDVGPADTQSDTEKSEETDGQPTGGSNEDARSAESEQAPAQPPAPDAPALEEPPAPDAAASPAHQEPQEG